MAFSDIVNSLDSVCLSTFGIQASWQPQAGGLPITITGIVKPPPLLEEMLPGSSSGVTNIYFFIHQGNIPSRGDTVTLNAVSYDVTDVVVDSQNGQTLKLRRNA